MEASIKTTHLFSILDKKLIEMLGSLSATDWEKQTRAKLWKVKDIAAHLLDGNLRTLSMSRDQFFGEKPENINTYQDLLNYLNQLNADWVKASRRLSPKVIINLLEKTGLEYNDHILTLNLFSPSIFPVDWAGEKQSQNWFHIAREYTEKWHHQQQIREAVNIDGIMTRELYFPVLDTFMRALPHSFRNILSDENTVVNIEITGEAGGNWYLKKGKTTWDLAGKSDFDSQVIINQEDAWKLFTKGFTTEEAKKAANVTGNPVFAEKVLSTVAVMA